MVSSFRFHFHRGISYGNASKSFKNLHSVTDPSQADLGSAMPTSGGLYWYANLPVLC